MLKNYKLFTKYLKVDEAAPRIPNSEEYWLKKGKEGKKVMIYTHDDLDGVYSAIVMKNYLESKGFEIVGYGIVNYQEAWTTTQINTKYINIALDFAEDHEDIDIYIDHHGTFEEGENRDKASIKTATGSAYEGICLQLGIPVDQNILSVIDMVDSAKYDDYNVDIEGILTFDLKKFKNKLEFAASFNQLLKRSDHKTFIEVIANAKDMAPSVYNVYRAFKILYPANNLNRYELTKLASIMDIKKDNGRGDPDALIAFLKEDDPEQLKGFEKDFLKDAEWRLKTMQQKTRKGGNKKYIKDQTEFYDKFKSGKKISVPGYQILGHMMFIPSGTWANALRGRAILEKDLKSFDIPTIQYEVLKSSPIYDKIVPGKYYEIVADIEGTTLNVTEDVTDSNIKGIKGHVSIDKDGKKYYYAKQPLFWIMLQYGNTLQAASINAMRQYVTKYLPKSKDGKPIANLGKYFEGLLEDFVYWFGYDVNKVANSKTVAGGHTGIGSLSNIFGKCEAVIDEKLITKNPTYTDNPKYKASDVKQIMAIRKKYDGVRFLDLMKNKAIQDLSGIPWGNIGMAWGDDSEEKKVKPREEDMNKKVMMADEIRDVQDVRKDQQKRAKEEQERTDSFLKKDEE